jgi:hypothetical protein
MRRCAAAGTWGAAPLGPVADARRGRCGPVVAARHMPTWAPVRRCGLEVATARWLRDTCLVLRLLLATVRLSSCPVATIGWLAGAGCHKGNYRPQPPLLAVRPGFSFLPPLFPHCFHLVTGQLEFGGRHYDLLHRLPMVGRWICGAEVDQRGGAAATCFCGLSACPRPGGVTRWRRPTSPSRTFPASFRLLEEDTALFVFSCLVYSFWHIVARDVYCGSLQDMFKDYRHA